MLFLVLVAVLGLASAGPYAGYTQPVIGLLDRVFLALRGNMTDKVSVACRNDTNLLVNGVDEKAFWALRFIDATGKPSTGLLTHSSTMLGFFSECIETTVPSNRTKYQSDALSGKYCMSKLDVQSEIIEKKNFNESIQIGLCVPSTCTDNDINIALNSAIRDLNGVTVTLSTCYIKENNFDRDVAAITITALLSIMVFLVVLGTIYEISKSILTNHRSSLDKKVAKLSTDTISTIAVTTASSEILCQPKEPKEKHSLLDRFLLCFSIIGNGKKILKVDQVEGSIDALHGIRFISMLWIIFGHTFSFAQQWLFFRNQPGNETISIDFFAQIIANGTLSVDSFLFLSGFLVAFVTLKSMKAKDGKLNLLLFYFHRYIRMTPLMMAIIAFCACIIRYLGNGPKWLENVSIYDDWCRKNWWTNAIYLQNFINRENMCLYQTWYSAVDMQLYLISPLIIYALYKGKKFGLPIIGLLLLITIGLTAYLTASHNYPAIPYISSIVSTDLMNEYYGYVYIKPYCRMGPYLIGMLLGYILYNRSQPMALPKLWVAFGWLLSIATNLYVIYAMWPANRGIPPTVAEATAYGALARTVWAISLAWITFACITGYGGFVNWFLSWKAMIPLSRLTYCAYLIHPVLISIFYNTREIVFDSSVYFMMYLVIGNVFFTYAVSLVLSLIFESPFINIEKLFHRKT